MAAKIDIDFARIKAFAFDVDGVFTDGGIFCDLAGELFRTFDSKDGFGVRMATLKGYPVAIITGGRSGSINKRFLSCGVEAEDIYLGSRDKIVDFDHFCKKYSLSPDEVLYVGDDIPDIPVINACGIGACPSDATEEVKETCDFISSKPGGRGCVREVVEKVMKTKGDWFFDVAGYKAKF